VVPHLSQRPFRPWSPILSQYSFHVVRDRSSHVSEAHKTCRPWFISWLHVVTDPNLDKYVPSKSVWNVAFAANDRVIRVCTVQYQVRCMRWRIPFPHHICILLLRRSCNPGYEAYFGSDYSYIILDSRLVS
jgi:hypothetical protein